MSSNKPPPSLFTLNNNKRFRNLYLSLTFDQTKLTQQDPITKKTTTGEVEVEGETDHVQPNKTKSIFIEKGELIKKLIKDDGLLKDSPTWYYLLLTSSTTPTIIAASDDDSESGGGDDDKASSSMIDIDIGSMDSSQKRRTLSRRRQQPHLNTQQPICQIQIQILAYHKNKSSWKHTYQQLSKILLMMGSRKPNLHRGRSDDTIFHPPNPPQGGKRKYMSFQQKWECTQWEWEEVSMMAFKQRFNSLLLQRRQRSTNNEFLLEEEESNPQHRPASLVFDQYFSAHFQANALRRSNHPESGLEEEDCGLLSPQNKSREEEDQSLHPHQLVQGESKKIKKTIPSHHHPNKPTRAVKLTTDLVARVSVEEFLETNPSVDQFLKFQKCKLLIDQISKHQQQQDLYLDQADSDCPTSAAENQETQLYQFQYKWPPHLDKLQFPIIWQWFSQWYQHQPTKPMKPNSHNVVDDGSPSPTRSNLVVGTGDDDNAEEADIVCKVEPSLYGEAQEEEIFEGKGGGDSSSSLQNKEEGNMMNMMIEHHPDEKLKEELPQRSKKQRFKALVLYSEERGVGKTSLAKSFVYNNQNWIIHSRNKFNADQFKLIEEGKLLLIDDFNFDPKIHHECFKALVTSEPTGIRDAYLNLQFKHGLPTIICTNDTKFYEYLLKSPDFQHDCMFCDVSGQYLGPPHTRPKRLDSSNNKATICADPKTLARFQQLTRESMASEAAAEDQDDEEDEEAMFMRAYNNNRACPRKRRNYQQLLLREAEAFLTGNPRHQNRGPIYEDDPQLQKRRRKIKNNMFL